MQGFNMGRYVPPDAEGVSSGNQLHKKRPPGTLRADGAQTVRFEMPFAVWCDTCSPPTLIGQGVRFNAAKRRVGAYHSTPVFAFRMRHPACGGELEIRTDPARTAYVVASGGRKRDVGDARAAGDSLVGDDGMGLATEKDRADAREQAFAKLEKTIADRAAFEAARSRIEELKEAAEKGWEDPYARNRRLRQAFRVGRKEREKEAAGTEALRDKMSLGIELVPAREEDAIRAGLVDFGGAEDDAEDRVGKALAKPLFEKSNVKKPIGDSLAREKDIVKQKTTKKEAAASKLRETLVSDIVGNTRAAKDPFLAFGTSKENLTTSGRLVGVKRKRVIEDNPDPPDQEVQLDAPVSTLASTALVAYDSD